MLHEDPRAKLFDDGVAYKRPSIKKVLPDIGDRTLDVILAKIPRVALTKRTILYFGRDLNALLAQQSQ